MVVPLCRSLMVRYPESRTMWRGARVPCPAMEHHFHGPSYTLGIEEELMIVDPEGYGLVNAIESLLQDAEDGEIKPELMESVLEISTNPAPETATAGEQLRRLRTQVRRTAE